MRLIVLQHTPAASGRYARAINPACAAYRIVNFCGAGGATIGESLPSKPKSLSFPVPSREIKAHPGNSTVIDHAGNRRGADAEPATAVRRVVRRSSSWIRPGDIPRGSENNMWRSDLRPIDRGRAGQTAPTAVPTRRKPKVDGGARAAAPLDSAGGDRIGMAASHRPKKSMTGTSRIE
jgi:hypothetical protein